MSDAAGYESLEWHDTSVPSGVLEGIIQSGEDRHPLTPHPDIDFSHDLRRGEKPYAPTDYRLYFAGAKVTEALKHPSGLGKHRQLDVGPHIAVGDVEDFD